MVLAAADLAGRAVTLQREYAALSHMGSVAETLAVRMAMRAVAAIAVVGDSCVASRGVRVLERRHLYLSLLVHDS